MKKRFLFITLLLILSFTIIFSSCKVIDWISEAHWLTINQKTVTNRAMSGICNAIERKDFEGVKSEFSAYDVKDVENFDESIYNLFDYIKGDNIRFSLISSGSETAAMGTYPKERVFEGVRYNIFTSTDEYKVNFSYVSFYSEKNEEVISERVGFTHFDIINVKNDRVSENRYYSGCPFGFNGINIDYKTNYIFSPEEYGVEFVYLEKNVTISPTIINDCATLEEIYNANKDFFYVESGNEENAFSKIVAKYNDDYFENKSLYLVGRYDMRGGYFYVPQFVYIDDKVVYVEVARFSNDNAEGNINSSAKQGILIFIELYEKVSSDVEAQVKFYAPENRNESI